MQTLIHLFYTCPVVKTFWKDIRNCLCGLKIFSFPFSLTDICFGVETSNKIINTFVKYSKHFIFSNKCKEHNLRFIQFKLEIIYLNKMERVIATRR